MEWTVLWIWQVPLCCWQGSQPLPPTAAPTEQWNPGGIWAQPTQHCMPQGFAHPFRSPSIQQIHISEPPLSNPAWLWLFSNNSAVSNLFLKTFTFNLSQKSRVGTLVHLPQSYRDLCCFEPQASGKQCYTNASLHQITAEKVFSLARGCLGRVSSKRSKTVII